VTAGERFAPPLMEAVGLVLRYGSRTALAASTFTAPTVPVTAVIGPNGSGKSTLLTALAGLVPVAGGSLRVLGKSAERARADVSYVLQSTVVQPGTPLTVRETVGMGRYPAVGPFRRFRRRDVDRVTAALRQLEIEDLAERHLHELSGGQRQRVLVAQGLAQDHRVLLLDDSRYVVLTTHDLDEARAADHVILVSGRVVSSGPPHEVCTRRNLELAFGLGGLHAWEGFLADPAHDPHGDAPDAAQGSIHR
jgi:iron complex transport system ATP-binding protein